MDYKEKLEEAKKLYKTANADQKYALELLFPELKEGEDELEWLKQFIQGEVDILSMDIRDDEDQFRLKMLKRSLEWLEKQGESIKIKKGKNYLCTKTHKYAGVEWIEGVKYYSPEDYSLINQGCTCYCPKYSKEEHNNFFKEAEYDGCLEKQGDQNKIEALRAEYEKGRADTIVEMNSTWSEEDEKNLIEIINIVQNISSYDKQYDRYINWLKSIRQRYTWKPTKEQMYMLEWLTTNVLDDGIVGNKAKEVLNTLIEQLKSL